MGWQFQVDGRPAGIVRDSWQRAAQDLVNDGYGTWYRGGIATDGQAAVVRVEAPADKEISKLINVSYSH
jgi:hypothetical protein